MTLSGDDASIGGGEAFFGATDLQGVVGSDMAMVVSKSGLGGFCAKENSTCESN